MNIITIKYMQNPTGSINCLQHAQSYRYSQSNFNESLKDSNGFLVNQKQYHNIMTVCKRFKWILGQSKATS